MKKVYVIAAILAVLLVALLSTTASATDVAVTASPSYISFSSAPITWDLNDITGDGLVNVDTIYYANPLGDTTAPAGAAVADAECQFTWTNDSTVSINITVNCGNFTGGSCDMGNSNSGSNGAATYGAYCWYSGLTYANKVIVQSSGSDVLYTAAAGVDKKWGAEIETRTNAWAGATPSTATMTITAAAA